MDKTSSPSGPSSAPLPPSQKAKQAIVAEQKPIGGQNPPPQQVSEKADALVSPPPAHIPVAEGQSILSREEKVEYRDQDGNLLDEEQVKALEGKVSFKTRYETRTRMVDAQGNEVVIPDNANEGVAPPHPDVEGVDRETAGVPEQGSKAAPNKQQDVKADESKEKSAVKSEADKSAKPASEGNEATGAK